MHLLPMSQWSVYYEGGNDICLAMHTNHGFVHWTKVELARPLQNLTRSGDLKGIIVNAVDGSFVI